jgi:hypothetical protein
MGLQAGRPKVYVNLFAHQRHAREAEVGLGAEAKVQAALSKGATAIHTAGRVVYVTNGPGRSGR